MYVQESVLLSPIAALIFQDGMLDRTRKEVPVGQDRDPADAAQLLDDDTGTEDSVS